MDLTCETRTEHSSPRAVAQCSACINSLGLHKHLEESQVYYYPYVINKGTDTRRDEGSCPASYTPQEEVSQSLHSRRVSAQDHHTTMLHTFP